jgi:hypothetical protein
MKSTPRKSLLKRLEASLNLELRNQEKTQPAPTVELLMLPAVLFLGLLMIWWFGAGLLPDALLDHLLLAGLALTFLAFGAWGWICSKRRLMPLTLITLRGIWAMASGLIMAISCWCVSAWCTWLLLNELLLS